MPLHRSSKMAPGVGVAPTSQRFGGAVAATEHARVGTRGQVGPRRQMVPSARLERARSREHQPLKLAGLPGSPTTVKMVRSGGVEPPRPRGPPLLRRRCMPVPSRAQKWRRGRGSNSPGQVAPSDFQSVAGTRPAASPRKWCDVEDLHPPSHLAPGLQPGPLLPTVYRRVVREAGVEPALPLAEQPDFEPGGSACSPIRAWTAPPAGRGVWSTAMSRNDEGPVGGSGGAFVR